MNLFSLHYNKIDEFYYYTFLSKASFNIKSRKKKQSKKTIKEIKMRKTTIKRKLNKKIKEKPTIMVYVNEESIKIPLI